MKKSRLVLFLFSLGVLLGCDGSRQNAAKSSGLHVVTTTGMIADAARRIGGEHIQVESLMGPGVDPHLYKASQGDVDKLAKADLIFYNGLNLEGKMGDIFVKMARKKTVAAVSDGVEPALLREPPEFLGHFDPHIWFDVEIWSQAVRSMGKTLAEVDPPHATIYNQNTSAYLEELKELHRWVLQEVKRIPPEQRLMLTAHDAFGYFGRAYGIEVRGLQGISTVSEFGLKDLDALVNLIVKRKVKAVFIESSVPKRSIEALVNGCQAKGQNVQIGGTLFSDAMGAPGTPEGNYIGMVKHNVNTLVGALGK